MLNARLTDVKRDGYKRPVRTTFEEHAAEWIETYPSSKQLKRSTASSYRTIIEKHLIPYFDQRSLGEIDVPLIEQYVAAAIEAGQTGTSVNHHLSVLSLVMKSAVKRGLISANPVAFVDRPREQATEWRILKPEEIGAVIRAFDVLIAEAKTEHERQDARMARAIYATAVETALRRGELLGLRWKSVTLADPTGPTLRVIETWVANGDDTPKSKSSRRTLPLSGKLADELFELRGWTPFDEGGDRVFANPRTGRVFDVAVYGRIFRKALAKAGITDRVRPFHDQRHTSLTNAAVAGASGTAVQARAGHSSPLITAKYVHLAGQLFREESELAARRLWGEEPVEAAAE